MPLERSTTDAARGRNIAKLRREGYPTKQAAAIAYREQRAAKKRRRQRARKNPAGDAVSAAIGALALGGLVGAGAGALLQTPASTGALTGAQSGIAVTGVGGLVVAIFSDKSRMTGLATAGIGLGSLVLFGLASNLLGASTPAAT